MSQMTASTINPWTLPRVQIESRKSLPDKPGVYFVFHKDELLYVGKSERSIKARWASHHRLKQLNEVGGIEIAAMALKDVNKIDPTERSLIAVYSPPLNWSRVSFGNRDKKRQAMADTPSKDPLPLFPDDSKFELSWEDLYVLCDDEDFAELHANEVFTGSQINQWMLAP